MNRRRFVVGLAGGVTAGSSLVSSGAFSSVDADRGLAVEVAHDRDAYLGLDELGEGTRSVIDDGTLVLRFPGFQESIDDPDLGLGSDSVYEFVDDAAEDGTPGLVRITNQGTNEAVVYSEHESTSEIEIELFDVADPARTALRDDPSELSPGEHVDVGLRVETAGVDPGTYDEELTVVAELPAN